MGLLKTAFYVALLGIMLYSIKQYMNGGVCKSDATISGKVVLITGANTGLGKETAADLVKRGGKVYMACRSVQRCSEAAKDIIQTTGVKKDNLVYMKLDLASTNSIREFAADFKKKEKKLDILINNAGVMFVPQGKTEDGFETTFGVNHLGHFLLTNLLMNEIVAAAPSRVITVSSMGHALFTDTINLADPMLSKHWDTYVAYGQSKLANVIFSRDLGNRLKGSGVTTYSLHPGAIPTDLTRHWFGYPIIEKIYKFVIWPFSKDVWHGAQTQICCAVDKNLADQTAKYYADCVEKLPGVPGALDDRLAIELWELSMKLLNMTEKDLHPKLLL